MTRERKWWSAIIRRESERERLQSYEKVAKIEDFSLERNKHWEKNKLEWGGKLNQSQGDE